jgi:hypothetical protein
MADDPTFVSNRAGVRVRVRVHAAITVDGMTFPVGAHVDVFDDEMRWLVAQGLAEYVGELPPAKLHLIRNPDGSFRLTSR